MIRWLMGKGLGWAVSIQKREMDDFLERTAAADSSELGLPVAMAANFRHLIRRSSGLDLRDPSLVLVQNPTIIVTLVKTVQDLQRRKEFVVAVGPLIWVHSLRAMTDLKLRPSGRELWKQLSRGFAYAEQAASTWFLMTSVPLDIDDYDVVPDGLGPQT